MPQDSASSIADRVNDRRARVLPVMVVIYVAQQLSYFLGTGAGTGDAPIQNIQLVSWLALSTTILLLLTTGGAWFYPRKVRRLANDEATRAHRDAALCLGFIASMIVCMVVYFVSMSRAVPGREAVHLVMSVGIAVALVKFAILERRAARHD
ncbi:hypothetical protein EWE75_24320 [Sphingomonas populi]|uniref:Uncharacterized protein n=1 Tax=Sphingomonas populi TaxID=2484750 RepID=A0A4Q6XQZ9_9SPHN|nr:hypothetical protein [Sphingomonas populi]RZF58636.1 hypothetical protein EWE75_24320 [Sphingomonas populi]